MKLLLQTLGLSKKSFRAVSIRHLSVDIAVICFSLLASLYLRLGSYEYFDHLSTALAYLPLIVLIRVGTLYLFKCYNVIWRYVSANDAFQLAKASAMSTALIVFFTFFIPDAFPRLPRMVYIIDGILVSLCLTGIRLLRRIQLESNQTKTSQHGQRTLIYGAGHNGRLLAHRFKVDPALNIHVVGFIDDDPEKQDMQIHGVPVIGDLQSLKSILESHRIAQLIITIGNLHGELLREIVQVCREFQIRPRIVTSLSQSKNMEIYRDVNLSDLLGRPKLEIDLSSVREMIKGKRILVTGAGGSIGSELSRQILSHDPAKLLLLDNSEYNLYEIDKELRHTNSENERVVPLLMDLKDHKSLRPILKEYMPELVFHAAAFKHVHLVEANPFSAILNNVYSTHHLLEVCREIDVKNFILISTDKAVNPGGVMGATKRVCELLVSINAIESRRSYCSVRFGNVLGSSGSLIPLLKKQILEGGPVTITHPDMTRFFMLIPEAVSLVLKASTISNPGDISVLKMGEPVKILDVARSLMSLMGKTETEVPIIFTGLRPGEKMFEELYIRGDELKTEHPDILTLPNGDSLLGMRLDLCKKLKDQINTMCDYAFQADKRALFELNDIIRNHSIPNLDKAKVEVIEKQREK